MSLRTVMLLVIFFAAGIAFERHVGIDRDQSLSDSLHRAISPSVKTIADLTLEKQRIFDRVPELQRSSVATPTNRAQSLALDRIRDIDFAIAIEGEFLENVFTQTSQAN